jgi:hypothetical protein
MRLTAKRFLVVAATTLAVTVAGYAYASPSSAVCALAGAIPVPVPTGAETSLVTLARQRIAGSFGEPNADPVILFWQDGLLARLALNRTGSSLFLGPRACVFIGPDGRNVDVVAHELMHAEVFQRIGPWARLFRLPAWLDEGIAMQVDGRSGYQLPAGEPSDFVRQLTTPAQFFVAGDKALTRNYAAAKSQVAMWLAKSGKRSLYPALGRIRAGQDGGAVTE